MMYLQNAKLQLENCHYMLSEIEDARLSYVPCGQVDGKDQPLLRYRHLLELRTQVRFERYLRGNKTALRALYDMTGVQIMTGPPSSRANTDSPNGTEYLTDIDIEYRLIEHYFEHYQRIVDVFRRECLGTPCRVRTKSGGERLSAFVPYLDDKIEFHDPIAEADEKDMLLEIFSINGLSRLDWRYSQIEGSLLEIPSLPKSAIVEIYKIMSEIGGPAATKGVRSRDAKVVAESRIGDLDIQWVAAEIKLKRKNKDGRPCKLKVHVSSRAFPTEYCRETSHASNRDEVVFTKFSNGSIKGYCHNCEERWWEVLKSPLEEGKGHPQAREVLTLEEEAAEVQRLIANAPEPIPYTQTRPSFRHFSVEHKRLVRAEGLNPMASTHEVNGQEIPVWQPQYEKLSPLFGGSAFTMNGQPQATEKHRVWNTTLTACPDCHGNALYWIDLFRYQTGYYCDGCHKDRPRTSLLHLELNRHLTGSFSSDFEGYLSEDPFWEDTALWENGRLTFLAASMNKGKTTFANQRGVELAEEHDGDYILCVPRISLAIEQHQKLTAAYGEGSFGLFHEGSHKSVGRLGAVCCLSSLPNVFGYEDPLTGDAYDADNAFIFIDEIDFSYDLLTLVSMLSRETKAILERSLHTHGLVIAGQTEYTAAVETFSKELEAREVLGYYNPATRHQTPAEIIVYPDVEGKTIRALADVMQTVQEIIDAGLHAYVFCATRRAVSILHEHFFQLRPFVFTRYTKNTKRSWEFLSNEKLTDTPLFLATSAAAVGISIQDPLARTVVLGGLVHGHLKCADIVQESVRDRGQHPLKIFLPTFENAFPISQPKATEVSGYEAQMKMAAEALDAADIKNTDKLAATYALNSLAEDDPLTFITHHLQDVAGFDVQISEASEPDVHTEARMSRVKELNKDSLENERRATVQIAVEVLQKEIERIDSLQKGYVAPSLFTTREVRQMDATEYTVIGYTKATEAAIAVGFDDETDRQRGEKEDPCPFDWSPKDLHTAIALVEQGIDTQALKKQMYGYIAARNDTLTAELWEDERLSGKELSALQDYRFIGELVGLIVDTLAGKIWETEKLHTELKSVLDTQMVSENKTYLTAIQRGAIGVKQWRKARFLNVVHSPVNFCLELITDFYPCSVKTFKDLWCVQNIEHLSVFSDAVNAYLYHKQSDRMTDLDVAWGDTGEIVRVMQIAESRSPKDALYAEVIALAKQRMAVKVIAEQTGVSTRKVEALTKDIRDTSKAERDAEILRRYTNRQSKKRIATEMGIGRTTVKRILDTQHE